MMACETLKYRVVRNGVTYTMEIDVARLGQVMAMVAEGNKTNKATGYKGGVRIRRYR